MADVSKGISGAAGGRRGGMSLTFSGIPELSRKLARDGEVWKRVQQAAIQGITQCAEDLLSKAQKIVPHDEGPLEASGNVVVLANGKPVHRRGRGPEAAAPHLGDAVDGQVGFNTPYALEQHERLDFQHKPGRQAKYLESPLKENAAAYEGLVADALRKALALP